MTGLKEHWRNVVPMSLTGGVCLYACMHAYMHTCVYTPEVFICVHILHYSNMTGCYSGIPNSRKKKVLNFVVKKKTQSGIYSSVLVLDEIYLEKLLENKITGN